MASVIPSWLKWYKKPSYVDLKAFANSLNGKIEATENGTGSARDSVISTRSDLSIPKNLVLERILSNKTCSPMSLYDFYMYLKHIEFSQENLEFYTWFRDYEKRYKENLSPKTRSFTSTTSSTPSKQPLEPIREAKHESMIIEKRVLMIHETHVLPEFVTFIESLVLYKAARYPRPCCTAFVNNPDLQSDEKQACSFPTATLTALPPSISHKTATSTSTIDPNIQELHQIVALFLTPGGPKELNIPPSMRKKAIASLSTGADSPEIFTQISEHIYTLLKTCSHRNFVRLGVNNGTFETLCMVTFVGILFTILGFLTMFLIAFASPRIHSSVRWRALATIPFWFIGIVFLLAGMRGSCFLLLLFSRRQELPWERVEDASSVKTEESNRNKIKGFVRKMMIFERKVRVRDVGLRTLQRKIVLQSVAGAVVGTAILEVFFLSLPIWKR